MSEEKQVPEEQPEETVTVGKPEPEEQTAAPTPEEDATADADSADEPAQDAQAEEAAAIDPKDIEEGKVFAILSYVFWPIAFVPIIQKNNAFALYHAKQVLILLIAIVALAVVNVIPCIGQIICLIGSLGVLVFAIMGLISAINGKAKPIPLIGKLAEQWFKGLQKTEA